MQAEYLHFTYRYGFFLIFTIFATLSCDLLSPDEDTKPPSILIDTPGDGDIIKLVHPNLEKQISFIAEITDKSGVVGASCYVDTALIAEKSEPSFGSTYQWTWLATLDDTGSHTIKILAKDDAGNEDSSAIVITLIVHGFALEFDGEDDYVEVIENAALQITDQITLEAWFKLEDGSTAQSRLVSMGPNGQGYELRLTEDASQIYLEFSIGPGDVGTNSPLSADSWYHIAATYDGSFINIYLNGSYDIDGSYTGLLNVATQSLFIGRSIWGHNYTGMIDEVRIWSIARSQSQIQSDMNRELSGSEAGLVGYWRFNEGTGPAANDQTANGNHGALYGGVEWVVSTADINP